MKPKNTLNSRGEEKVEKEEINFEQAMQQLEQITNELEKGELNLEDSVKKFEQGMEISKKCNEILQQAEKRITVLIQKEEGLEEQNFIPKED